LDDLGLGLFFDFSNTHPNIKPIRLTPYKAYEYVLKDGNIIFHEGTPPKPPSKQNNDDKWHTIMSAQSKEEFLKVASELAPRETCLHFNSLMSYADWKYRDNLDEYSSCEITCHYDKYPQLTEWVQTYIRNPYNGRPKSLVMWGETLLGKTLWTRSLGKHACFPGLFMLEGFNPSEA